MQLGLAAWHRYMTSGSADLLADLLADDVMFYSPVSPVAVQGKDTVLSHLLGLGQLFGNGSGFRYVRELVDGGEACLEYEATADEIVLNGVDLIRFDLEGRIVEFKSMIRTAAAIALVQDHIEKQLQAV